MISIVICSRQSDIPPENRRNIETTIGCEHEIIVIDNSANRYNIFQAYNKGVERSKGDILLLLHDDVTYRSNGWGKTIEHILQDESIGLVGAIGSHVMPDFPAYYSESPYISSHNADNDEGVLKAHTHGYWDEQGLAEVSVVDGQQMFIPRRLFPPLMFDESRYTGFHGYDMDISMQVQALGKRVVVTNKIDSEHIWSERKWENRNMTSQLYEAMDIFVDKWRSRLPIITGIDKPAVEVENVLMLWRDSYRYRMIRQSKAYRLGKILLRPFSSSIKGS